MKQKKSILIITIIFLIMLIVSPFSKVQAAEGSLRLNIKKLRSLGHSYSYGNNKYVFKIFDYDNQSINNTIYCIKGGPGFGSDQVSTGGSSADYYEYKRYFDLKDPNSSTNPIPDTYKTALPTINSDNYKALIWLLDNCYVMPKSKTTKTDVEIENRNMLLDAAERFGEAEGGYDAGGYELSLLTDDDIDVVQQLAIWHFTNPEGDNYHFNSLPELYLNAVEGTLGSDQALSDFEYEDGVERADACRLLFDYLVETATAKAPTYKYTSLNNDTVLIDFERTTKTIVTEGTRTIVGPYKLTKNADIDYTLSYTVTGGNNSNITDCNLLDSNKNLTTKTIKDFAEEGAEFYISIPSSADTSEIKLKITGNCLDTKITYWSAENPSVNKDQPVVKVTKEKTTFNNTLTLTNRTPGNYELELIKVDGNNENKKLQGAEFEVTMPNGTKQTLTTNANGSINLGSLQITQAGTQTITIKETKAPNKYVINKEPINLEIVTVEQGNTYAIQSVKLAGTTLSSSSQDITNGKTKLKAYVTNNKINIEMKNFQFDLALRKFIISIVDKKTGEARAPQEDRTPQIDSEELSKLANGQETTALKVHPKYPLEVKTGDKVIYKIRVYNEGGVSGYATEVTDYLPAGLKFIENSSINQEYGWSNPTGDGKTIVTNYLQNTLLNAFGGSNLSYADLQIECEVIATVTENDQTLKNIAEITEDKDEDKNDVDDRDSTPDNVETEDYGDESQEDDDDFEPLVLKGQYFDLSLRKYIYSVKEEDAQEETKTTRAPIVDVTPLKDGSSTTAIYNHPKNALPVSREDIVTYKLRVYNEGQIDGYVTEITDHLPEQLEFLPENEINQKYEWQVSANGRTVKTNITSPQNENSSEVFKNRTQNADKLLLQAYNGENDLDYIELEIVCKVKADAIADQKIVNIAEITGFTDENGNTVKDRDSDVEENKVRLPSDEELPKYNEEAINRGDEYIPGQQDDDDFEPVIVREKQFDLSLRKFIYSVSETEDSEGTVQTSRVPKVDVTPLKDGSSTTAIYNHPKNPVTVSEGDIVRYELCVYNEGEVDGYVTEITDHLPEQLEFLPNNEINKKYGWQVSANGRTVKTNITSPTTENSSEVFKDRTTSEDKLLIKAFNGGTDLDFISLPIVCKVKENTNFTKKIVNIAEITGFTDKKGRTVKDRDSDVEENKVKLPTDEKLPEYNEEAINRGDKYIPGQQDDDDFEPVIIEKKYFDLALRKFIISIVDSKTGEAKAPEVDRTPQIDREELEKLLNGEETTANKVHPKNPLSVKTGDKVIYKIRVYNEGQIAGYATEVTDHLPAGLKFVENSSINQEYGWSNPTGDGKTIVTNYLANKLINAFNGTKLEYEDLQIECEVEAKATDKDQKLKNIAEITDDRDKDGNEVDDRDSTPNNVDKENYEDKSQEDDDDFEDLILKGQYFDLSLRKFISGKAESEDDKNIDNSYFEKRAPIVDVTPLKDGSSTTAIYNHTKEPVSVYIGNVVEYTIRVYNEGQIDGYVEEITDHLPEQLEFLVNDELNAKYGWTISKDGRTVKTTITSPEGLNANRDEFYKDRAEGQDKVLLKAFDGEKLDYIDVKIRCKVKENIDLKQKITNIAEISKFVDENKNPVEDRDSDVEEHKVKLPSDEELPSYNDEKIERGDKYIPGQEDDDDFEKLVLQKFDLSLRKFITGVNDLEITNRVPVFTKISETEYKYEHTKEPVLVANGNTVIYTLRIFNEGNISGYAKEIKDNLPQGLEFLPEHSLNQAYRWVMYKEDGSITENVEEAVSIRTDYLSKEQEKEEGANLIKAFDPSTMTMPDYKDVKIAFKVTEPNTSDRIIINTAEITDDSDEKGNEVEDIDSIPDNDKEEEDDIDIEKIKVQYFDLSLKKWVTESIVTYNGKTTVTKTGHTGDENPEPPAKVEIRGSRIDKTTVKFKFNIKVTNEGEIAGYAKELIDYIPEGLKFEQKDNPKWKVEDGKVVTDQLKDTLLQPGESATVEIILTWINNKNNLGEKVNWAEISKDENEYGSPDIDSTPGNNQKGEDDIDRAPVILAVVTGTAPTYITLALVAISLLTGGVVLIKKFV